MDLIYKKATVEDLDLLVTTRIEVLRVVNQLSEDTDMKEVEEQTRLYYQKALQDGTHTAVLVFDGDRFAGAGGITVEKGTLAVSANQKYMGDTVIKGGATLSATGVTFAGSISLESGASITVPEIAEGKKFVRIAKAAAFEGWLLTMLSVFTSFICEAWTVYLTSCAS